MKPSILFALLILCSLSAFSQHSSLSYKKLADSLYRHHNYASAITYYERSLKKSKQPGAIMLQVANCYKRINNITEAESWYAKAKDNGASFTAEDTYEYAQVFMMQEKRAQAEALLAELIEKDPGAIQARKTLDDIRNYDKFFTDTTEIAVTSLPINTPQSEFAPEYYKDGIVFSSAQEEKFSKKKYHWDDSHFLNLYFSKKNGTHHEPAQLFDQNLDSKFHDGPVSFYANEERMIVNRNRPLKITDKKDTWIWHLALFEGRLSADKTKWELTALPFDEPPYSSAHPWVSEDGNTIYFSSDRPGGYGGMDLYRVVKKNGIWTKPFNLGPTINTPENEVFPFLINNTLYFSSDGHGGMGGLDNFKSVQTVNGFAPPVNLGYPINSHFDDFSLVTKPDEQRGYFASTRSGNDDLYEFHHRTTIHMLARIVDGQTNEPVSDASIELMTYTGDDVELTSDEKGLIPFELPRESAFVLIASKEGKSGMLSGTALPAESREHKIHPVMIFGDTSQVACIGIIKNELGFTDKASRITVLDETTGKEVQLTGDDPSIVSFFGERNHQYTITIENVNGEITTHQLTIDPNDARSKSWEMVLKESTREIEMAARIMLESDSSIVTGYSINLITYVDPDVTLTSDDKGIVNFTLKDGTAFILASHQEQITGMMASVAGTETSKTSIIHPLYLSLKNENELPVATLLTNQRGEALTDVTATVTDQLTGELIKSTLSQGMLTFLGEKGKGYNIAVDNKGQPTVLQEIVIRDDTKDLEKIALVIDDIELEEPVIVQVSELSMTARMLQESDNTPVDSAQVTIITYIDPDQELKSGQDGLVDFTLKAGTAYMIVAEKGELTGMHAGVAEAGTTAAHDVYLHALKKNETPVVIQLTDEDGSMLADAQARVREKISGKEIASTTNNGIVSFIGEENKEYTIAVDLPQQGTILDEITITGQTPGIAKSTLTIDSRKLVGEKIPVTLTLKDSQGNPVSNGTARLTNGETDSVIEADINNGELTFEGEKGKEYTVELIQNDTPIVYEEVVVPQTTQLTQAITLLPAQQSTIEPVDTIDEEGGNSVTQVVTPDTTGAIENETLPDTTTSDNVTPVLTDESTSTSNQVLMAANLTDQHGQPLTDAHVTVVDKTTGQSLPAEMKNGLIQFQGESGKAYIINVEHDKYETAAQEVLIPEATTISDTLSISLTSKTIQMAARVFKADDQQPLEQAQVTVITMVEPDQELITNGDGVIEFTLPDDIAYMIIGKKEQYSGMHSGIASKEEDKSVTTHPVPAHRDTQNIPVIGLITTPSGERIQQAVVSISEYESEKQIPVTFNKGMLSFMGQKGSQYTVEVLTDHYEKWSQVITIDSTDAVDQRLTINLVPKHIALPTLASMVILNESGLTKVYVSLDGESLHEVIEENDALYIQNGDERIPLGAGRVTSIKNNSTLLTNVSLSADSIMSIPNVYFDYNSPKLDGDDEAILDRVHDVLTRYPSVQLTIQAHADDRGSDRYNQALSRRRARSVRSYLLKKGLVENRVASEAFGESLPAIRCPDNGCTEEDHQKNRRAEFALRPTPATVIIDKPASQPVVQQQAVEPVKTVTSERKPDKRSRYEIALEQYGNHTAEGLTFKVTIGAYRYNHNLTFPELQDLGTVESKHHNGITYYYLSGWNTLREVEDMRQTVIARGVKDAGMSIYFNGEKINFQRFISLVTNNGSPKQ